MENVQTSKTNSFSVTPKISLIESHKIKLYEKQDKKKKIERTLKLHLVGS